jgi:hypothetical protein
MASSFDIMNPLFRQAVDTKPVKEVADPLLSENAAGATGEILSFISHVAAIMVCVVFMRNTEERGKVLFYITFTVPFFTTAFAFLTGRKKLVHDLVYTAVQLGSIGALCWYWSVVNQTGPFAFQYLLTVFFVILAL